MGTVFHIEEGPEELARKAFGESSAREIASGTMP